MEEKIFEIVKKVQYGEISIDSATAELLLLFSVSGSLPKSEEIKKLYRRIEGLNRSVSTKIRWDDSNDYFIAQIECLEKGANIEKLKRKLALSRPYSFNSPSIGEEWFIEQLEKLIPFIIKQNNGNDR